MVPPSIENQGCHFQCFLLQKNVQDLLAKHSPTKAQCENKEKAYSGNESDLLATVGTSGSIQTTSPPECENAPGDIGAVTRAQLRKMGIEIEVSSPPAVYVLLHWLIPTLLCKYFSAQLLIKKGGLLTLDIFISLFTINASKRQRN